MRNQIIATVVAALILFIWQFLSWGLINFHSAETQYTAKQDTILRVLSENLEEGHYYLPTVAPGASSEEMEAAMSAAMGKPWATVSYHSSMEMSMGMNMVRGLLVDLVTAFLLVWLMMKIGGLNFSTALLASLAIGFIGYLTIPYLHTIWFETNSIGHLIDAIGQWGLVGVWLGWYLPGRVTASA